MGLNAAQLKAIKWYCDQHNLKPALSVPPTQMIFTDKKTMRETDPVHLDAVIAEYRAWNEEDKKRRAKERRLERERQKKEMQHA